MLVWDTRTLAIGRAKENDIVVADNEISRKHALFKKEGKAASWATTRPGTQRS